MSWYDSLQQSVGAAAAVAIWILTILVLNLTSMICALGAVYVASRGQDGWGWMLFVAVILATTIKGEAR